MVEYIFYCFLLYCQSVSLALVIPLYFVVARLGLHCMLFALALNSNMTTPYYKKWEQQSMVIFLQRNTNDQQTALVKQ